MGRPRRARSVDVAILVFWSDEDSSLAPSLHRSKSPNPTTVITVSYFLIACARADDDEGFINTISTGVGRLGRDITSSKTIYTARLSATLRSPTRAQSGSHSNDYQSSLDQTDICHSREEKILLQCLRQAKRLMKKGITFCVKSGRLTVVRTITLLVIFCEFNLLVNTQKKKPMKRKEKSRKKGPRKILL